MVLMLKHWKSRSSPGIAAGGYVRDNPFMMFQKPLPVRTERRFFCLRARRLVTMRSKAYVLGRRLTTRRVARPTGRPRLRKGRGKPSRRMSAPALEANNRCRGVEQSGSSSGS